MDDNVLYSKEVIEFTAVANEYCKFLEEASANDGKTLLTILQKLLPLLYLKALNLPDIENRLEEDVEKYVREEDWQAINDLLKHKLGSANDFIDINHDENSTEELVYGDLAENLADIYQDLKDFLMVYRIGTNELMNDALWECKESFRLYWGQTLADTIRAVHYAMINPDDIGADPGNDPQDRDKSEWIISRRQDDFRRDNDDI